MVSSPLRHVRSKGLEFLTMTLPDTIPAAVLESPKALSIKDIPLWRLEQYGDPDLVLVRVEACGVCGSDFRYYLGENPWAQHTLGRFVPNPPNIVLGHEYAGTVVAALTAENHGLLGRRVAPVCSKVCNACDDCRNGRSRLCANTVHMGHGQGWGDQDFYPGAYAQFTLAWGSTCHEIPDDLSFAEAAMMDILAVCVHVAETGGVQPGRPVLSIGSGPAGNGVVQVARLLGASKAVLLDRSDQALSVADRQNLGLTLNSRGLSPAEIRRRLDPIVPEGFGTVFDTVGSPESLDLGLSVLGKGGTLVNMAVHDEEIPINFMRLGSERRIVTSCNFEVGDYPKALAWLAAKRLSVKEWLTPIRLNELPDWFEKVTSNEDKGAFKLVVEPWS